MRKSDLPVVINQTLNNAAFDVKTKTMPRHAAAEFVERNKTFFKSVSRVKKSGGFNIKNMKAEVGFIGMGSKQNAVEGLKQQERGGTIKDRGFIAMDDARVSKSNDKQVRAANRLKKVNYKRIGNKKTFQKQVRKLGTGKNILYKNTVFKIQKIEKKNIKLIPLYSVKKGRAVKIKPTHFMKKASNESRLKMDNFFIQNAKKRILK